MKRAGSVLRNIASKLRLQYPYVLSGVLIILLVLIVYGQDLAILANEALYSEALTHVLLIPGFTAIIFYLKKDAVLASYALLKQQRRTRLPYIDEVTGVALCLVAFLIYWYGSSTVNALEYHLLSLPVFVMGVTLVLFNFKTLTTLLFPILFLFFLTPLPTDYMYTVGSALAAFNTHAAFTLLHTAGLPVALSLDYAAPTIILTSAAGHSTHFAIDVACSGIYSLLAFAMVAAFLGFVAATSNVKKVVLAALGFLTFEALSILRITTIIAIAHWAGRDLAMAIFHAGAGLVLIFIGMLITLVLAEKFLHITIRLRPPRALPCPHCSPGPSRRESFCAHCGQLFTSLRATLSHRFWTKLSLLLIGCAVATLAVHAPTFALAQETIQATAGYEQATNMFPAALAYPDVNYTLKLLYRDTDFERLSGQDAALTYAYFPDPASHAKTVYVFVGVSSSYSRLHSWEVCLITWQTAQGRQPLVTTLESRDVQLLPDTPLIARYLVFYDTRSTRPYTQVTLYWYERATFNTGLTVEQKYVRISLIITIFNSTDYEPYENQLLTVGQEVATHWQPLTTQALISLGIPAQQLLLAAAVAFLVVTQSAQYSTAQRRRTLNLRLFTTQASPKERTALETILALAKERKNIDTADVRDAIAQKTQKPVRLATLLHVMKKLEAYDFIRREIITVDNRPTVVWRAQISPLYKS